MAHINQASRIVRPPSKPSKAPAPEWVTETPAEDSYNLTMFSSGGEAVQDIVLARAEYLDLKQYLAMLRGHLQ